MSGFAENERDRLWSNFEKSGSVYDYLLYRSAVNGEGGDGLFDQNGAVRRGDDGFFGGFGDTNNGTHH